jgi:hypothetical protein
MSLSCQDGDRAGWHHTIARFTPPSQSRGELTVYECSSCGERGGFRGAEAVGLAGWLMWLAVHMRLLTGFGNRVPAFPELGYRTGRNRP